MKIISLDQATRTTGYAVFEGDICVETGLLKADGLLPMLDTIRDLIARHEPEKVAIEDIQYQSNQSTYKLLAQLQGALLFMLYERGIEAVVLAPSTWRSIMGIKGKKRAEQKQAAIDYFNGMYTSDESEAILIGLAAKEV